MQNLLPSDGGDGEGEEMMDSLMLGSVDALNTQPEQIDVTAMIDNLSRVRRWNGGGELSVLQHMMHVALILQQDGATKTTALAGLTHDLHEYVTGDLPAPLLDCLLVDTGAELRRVTDVQRHIQMAIEQRLNLDLTGADLDAVDRADKQARVDELDLPLAMNRHSYLRQIPGLSPAEAVTKYKRGLAQLGVAV
jgi:hypothetical protein